MINKQWHQTPMPIPCEKFSPETDVKENVPTKSQHLLISNKQATHTISAFHRRISTEKLTSTI